MAPMGRPTDDPKTIMLRTRVSEDDMRRLEYCAKATGMTKSEIVRQAIQEVYNRLKKEDSGAT